MEANDLGPVAAALATGIPVAVLAIRAALARTGPVWKLADAAEAVAEAARAGAASLARMETELRGLRADVRELRAQLGPGDDDVDGPAAAPPVRRVGPTEAPDLDRALFDAMARGRR